MRGMLWPALALLLSCSQTERSGLVPAPENDVAMSDTATVEADVEGLRAVDQRALVAVREGDALTLDALYADDAVLVNPGAEPLEGRAAIDSLHRGEMNRLGYILEWEPIRVESAASGDLGYVYGRWAGRSEDGSLPDDHGFYVNVYRKVDGTWRTVVEVNGSSTQRLP